MLTPGQTVEAPKLAPRMDAFLNVWLVMTLCLSAWLWSGLRIVYIPYLSVATLMLLLCVCGLKIHAHCKGYRRPFFSSIDPLVPIGLLLLLYGGIQVWNAGRLPYFDVGLQQWVYAPAPYPRLPSSYNRGEAFRFMQWFWVAWGLAITTRFLSRNGHRAYLRRSMIALTINAGLLSLFGLFTFFITPGRMFGLQRVGQRFFASFPYVNHAAAFFVMMAAVAAGLLLQITLTRPPRDKHDGRWILLFTLLTFLCVVGANFAFSRAGIILAWGLTACGAIYGLFKSWRILKPAARLNMAAATFAAVAVFYFFISGFGSDHIRRRFTVRSAPTLQMIPQLAGINLDLTVRPRLWQAGWEVFKSHRVYGTGGWGFRYALAMHISPDEWSTIVERSGRANVHNDPIQFLSEFGIVGSTILILGLGILLWPLLSRKTWRDTCTCLVGIGLLLVYIFSLVDLPFRCPAVLWTWTVLLAWLPVARMKNHSAREDCPTDPAFQAGGTG